MYTNQITQLHIYYCIVASYIPLETRLYARSKLCVHEHELYVSSFILNVKHQVYQRGRFKK